MGKLSEWKESFLEVLWIMKNTLGTFWFWVPIAYFAFVLLQLWMMFYIHPLTLAIVPIILIIYGIRLENKRTRLRYGLDKPKRLSATRGIGANAEPMSDFEWKVSQAVDQYERMLREEKEEEEEEG